MKLGLIGPGRHGSRYLQERNGGRYFTRVLSRTPRTDLPDWVTGTTKPEEFFAPGIDGVVIATPIETHVAIAMEAMRRGMHVLCEKPLADGWPGCAMLLSASQTLGKRLAVAHTDLFHSAIPPERYGWEGPRDTTVEYGGPTGDLADWAPHGIALAMYFNQVNEGSWTCDYSPNDWRFALTWPMADNQERRCSVRIRRGVTMRRANVRYFNAERREFDGTAPSDPSPIRNMLDVFVSGKEDRRMSYDFTRAVYRVLLTDPD